MAELTLSVKLEIDEEKLEQLRNILDEMDEETGDKFINKKFSMNRRELSLWINLNLCDSIAKRLIDCMDFYKITLPDGTVIG